MLSVVVNGASERALLWLEGEREADGSLGRPRRECELCGLKGAMPDVTLF